MVIDNFELSDVVVSLHDAHEFEQDFGCRLEEHLLFTFAFGIDDCSEGIGQDIDLHHESTIKIIIFILGITI